MEKIYEIVLAYELEKQGLQVERQVFLPIFYDHIEFKEGLKLDILVEKKVICEVKAIEQVNPVWDAQVLSHLTLTNLRLGFLLNFNVPLMKQGIKRIIK